MESYLGKSLVSPRGYILRRKRKGRRSNRLDFNAFSVLLLSKPFDIIVSERGRSSRVFFEGKLVRRVGWCVSTRMSALWHFVSVVYHTEMLMSLCMCIYIRARRRKSLKKSSRAGRKECKLYISLSIVLLLRTSNPFNVVLFLLFIILNVQSHALSKKFLLRHTQDVNIVQNTFHFSFHSVTCLKIHQCIAYRICQLSQIGRNS